MRVWRNFAFLLMLLNVLLAGCAAPLLLGAQGQLLGALLRPLVGANPADTKLFEQPVIKTRMVALLGEERYSTTVSLLNTATAIQQEVPLIYVVSRYSPLPDLAQKDGFDWNSDSNRMALMLVDNQGAASVFAEPQAESVDPASPLAWPQELAVILNKDNSSNLALPISNVPVMQ